MHDVWGIFFQFLTYARLLASLLCCLCTYFSTFFKSFLQKAWPTPGTLAPACHYNESPYPDCRRKHKGWWLCKTRVWVHNVMMSEKVSVRDTERQLSPLSPKAERYKKVGLRTFLLKSLLTPCAISTTLRVQGQWLSCFLIIYPFGSPR